MRDQLTLDHSAHWYALVSIAPQPETHESANVAVVFGNGRAYHLRYLKNLPRLCGIAPSADVRVYQAVLEHCAQRVAAGVDPTELRLLLGPQMAIRDPVPLHVEPSSTIMERIADRYLAPPRFLRGDREEQIRDRSVAQLDVVTEKVNTRGLKTQRDVRPNSLYGSKIENLVKGRKIPAIARAWRAMHRDVLVDALRISPGDRSRDVREVSSRIGEAFFIYDSNLRPAIRSRVGTEIRLVGVLHALPPDATAAHHDLRDFTRNMWESTHATVLEGTVDEIQEGLSDAMEWARAGN